MGFDGCISTYVLRKKTKRINTYRIIFGTNKIHGVEKWQLLQLN